jgi:hypothetical protein
MPGLDPDAIRRAAAESGTVVALCDALEAAEQRLQALRVVGDADGPITRQMIMATLLVPRNTGDLDAYVDAVHMLIRIAVQGATVPLLEEVERLRGELAFVVAAERDEATLRLMDEEL